MDIKYTPLGMTEGSLHEVQTSKDVVPKRVNYVLSMPIQFFMKSKSVSMTIGYMQRKLFNGFFCVVGLP